MRAIVVHRHGPPSVLTAAELDDPRPGVGEVLVRVNLTNVNFRDVQERRGAYAARTRLPYVPGLEATGTIAGLGEGVTGFDLGQRVVAFAVDGSYAELMRAAAVLTYPLPDGVADEAVAGLTAAVTAENLLSLPQAPVSGRCVVVHSAAGGVGLLAVQIARAPGVERDLAATAEFGSVVVFGQSCGEPGRVTTDHLHRASRSLIGYSSGHLRERHPERLRAPAERFLRRVAEGKLRLTVGARFDLSAARDAHAWLESGQSSGKLLLAVGPDPG